MTVLRSGPNQVTTSHTTVSSAGNYRKVAPLRLLTP